MILLDMRTVVLSYAISSFISMVVISFLWANNRHKYSGLQYWMAGSILHFVALGGLTLRGFFFVSWTTTLSNISIVSGIFLILIGLEHFTGQRSSQVHNYILLAIYLLVDAYFIWVVPDMVVRYLVYSLVLTVIYAQCAWLMLHRAGPEVRQITRGAGYVFITLCVINALHFAVDLAVPPGDDFFQSHIYDALILITNQMLFIMLTFTLFLMVNQRLKIDLEKDTTKRSQVEDALRVSEEKFYKAFYASPDAITITRMKDGQYVEVNDGFQRLTGYTRQEALSSSSLQLSIWVDPQERSRVVNELLANGRIEGFESNFRTKAGDVLTCLVSAEIIQLGEEAHILAVVRDITRRKLAEESLRTSEETFRTVFHSSPVALAINREEDRLIVDVNEAFCLLTGFSREEAIGRDALGLTSIRPEDSDRYRQMRIESGSVRDLEIPIKKKSGETATVQLSSEMISLNGEACVLTSLNDLTARKQAERIVNLRLALWEYAANHSVAEVMQKALDEIDDLTGSTIGFYHFLSPDQNVIFLQAWSTRTLAEFCVADGNHLHYSVDEAGVWVDSVRERRPVIHNDYKSLPNRKGYPEGHADLVRELVVPTIREGRVVAILGVGNKPSDYNEQDVNLVSYIADLVWSIVEQKQASEEIYQLNTQLERLAMTDDLTGLMNRRAFFIRGASELEAVRCDERPCGLLMMDVDRFKVINDSYGHEAGDQVLQRVAGILAENVRDVDLVARLGGEEFAVLQPNLGREACIKLAERLRQAVEQASFNIHENTMRVTISVGVALYDNSCLDFDTILRNADRAMYQAKSQGRNRVVVLA